MTLRGETNQVMVGGVAIGGGADIAVQSMTNTKTHDVQATVAQIHRLEALGCEIIRVAANDELSVRAIRAIKAAIHIPLVADIHFNADLAVMAVESGVDKLRINPGNIGSAQRVRRVADAAKAHGIPIRVGVNAGSLEKEILRLHGVTAQALVASAMGEIRRLEEVGFCDIVVSMKASNAPMCVQAYQMLAKEAGYPLHLGITEAGVGENGVIKSAVGLGAMLLGGIGDTIRVSLTGEPEQEVTAAYSILRACGLRKRGVEIISCPTCGRTRIDVEGVARQVEARTAHITRHITVAVMGCAVNGPGEAREADVGLAGGDGEAVLFSRGKILRKVSAGEMTDALLREIEKLT